MQKNEISENDTSSSVSPQSTTSSTSNFESLAKEFDSFFVWDTERESWCLNTDWEELEDSVMDWFEKKGIDCGKPSCLQDKFFDSKKKAVVLKRALSLNKNKFQQKLKERVGGKLCVNI